MRSFSRALATALPVAALAVLVLGRSRLDAAADAPKNSPPKTAEAAAPASSLTGILSEEEFKALHQLTKKKAPPARGKMIQIAGSRAYLSVPEKGKPPFPGLVVIHEWWGLNDNIEHWTDRLAADGYAALAVDLYGGRVADNPDSAMAYMKRVDQKRATEILLAADKFLATDSRVMAAHRGSIGWCFGGGQSLQLALAAPDLEAAVMYYGFPVNDAKVLGKMKAHLLGIFGNRDKAVTPDVVNAFQAALDSSGAAYQFRRYDAQHAFANPSNPNYDQTAATAAWNETRSFLEEHLKSAHQ